MLAGTLSPFSVILCTSCTLRRYFAHFLKHSQTHNNLVGKKILGKPTTRLFNQTRNIAIGTSNSLRVLFFGNDSFSLESLRLLYLDMKDEKTYNITKLDVVTSAKSKANPIRKFAMEQHLKIFDWPPQIQKDNYDIGVVVSFGQLIPEKIIQSFKFGMLNVHASLLPRWRGAAPIIYTILNGDTESGVTIMQIAPKKFDIGNIVSQSSCEILCDDTSSELSERLALLGAKLLLQSLKDLPYSLQNARCQPTLGITYAPRVTSVLAQVKWQEMDSSQIHNLSRALADLYPLSTNWHGIPVKLYGAKLMKTQFQESTKLSESGFVEFHRPSSLLRVSCKDKHWIYFSGVGLPGKKIMKPIDFYNGYISKRSTETEKRFSSENS